MNVRVAQLRFVEPGVVTGRNCLVTSHHIEIQATTNRSVISVEYDDRQTVMYEDTQQQQLLLFAE